jgi:hypothetical protein
LYPETDEVLGSQLKATECETAPEPLNEAVVGEFVALLLKETEPSTIPLACGVKAILTPTLAPEVIVNGNVAPLKLYPVPVKFPADTVTLLLPVLESVNNWLTVLATVTFPKVSAVGLALNR